MRTEPIKNPSLKVSTVNINRTTTPCTTQSSLCEPPTSINAIE